MSVRELDAARLADGRIQVETGLSQIAQARQQMEAALTALQAAGGQDMVGQAGDAALSQTSYGQLLTQLEALRAQEAQLEAQLAGIEEGEAQLVQGRRSLQEAEAEIADREEELEEKCRAIGGQRTESNADFTVRFDFLPYYPLLLKVWFADEEFPASGKLLLDTSADHYLMIEDAVTAGQIVMEKLVGVF